MADDENLDVDEVDLEGDDADDGDLVLDEAVVDEEEEVDIEALIADPAAGAVVVPATSDDEDDDDENLDLEEELHPDDVEEPLDVLLAERTAAERIDEEEADLEDEDEPDNPTEGTGKIVPRRDDEFLCRSCFLVKPLSQLAKGEKDLCRDCE